MSRSRRANDAFYNAAARFVQECLRCEGSLFTPGSKIWCAENAAELHRLIFAAREDSKYSDFIARLREALTGAEPGVVQLAAEALYVLLLPQDTRLSRKREHIVALLSLCEQPVGLPDELSDALEHGIASYGMAVAQRFAQYLFLLGFANAWTKHAEDEREAMLLDPERFRSFVFSQPRKGASAQVEGLLHMVFPDYFEPIVSVEVKRKIVEAFPKRSRDLSLSIDRRIALIREGLARELGENFSFFDPEVRPRWEQPTDRPAAADSGGQQQRAWLVRAAKSSGPGVLSQWFEEDIVALALPKAELFELSSSEVEIHRALSQANPGEAAGTVRRLAAIVKRFLSIAEGDLIVTPSGDELFLARAKAAPSWGEAAGTPCIRRPVQWLNRDAPISRGGLKDTMASLYARLQTLQTVCDLKEELDAVRRLVARATGQPLDGVRRGAETLLPEITDELGRSLHLPRRWLGQAFELLREKRQLIFYGPPGTGKTFVAQALGEHIRSAGGDWQLVQFHPAYSYEDFFEGYRPSPSSEAGALQFHLRRGPLRLLAEQAAANPQVPYLLVIDEINRGNIAKIFGELYFLLEYRDRPIRLQYSPEQPFRLPHNLFLLGTMNTADRSIALVDSALRRRFFFYPFLPRAAPVREVLSLWLAENSYPNEAAQLLAELNDVLAQALPDEDFAIGPSYLMSKDGPPDLKRAWSHSILPLLAERFYGLRSYEDIEQEFGLAALRARLAPDQPTNQPEEQAEQTRELSGLFN